MDTETKREIEDLTTLIQALQRGVAAQAAEIDRLQRTLDRSRIMKQHVQPPVQALPFSYRAA